MTRAECEAAVVEGKLGIEGCFEQQDYWAGAVKQCGGVGNMPTMADLGKIASAIYKGNPTVGAYNDVSNLTYESGTATSLGLPEPSFYLWSGEEYSKYSAYYRDFSPTYTYCSDTNSRTYSGNQAICRVD